MEEEENVEMVSLCLTARNDDSDSKLDMVNSLSHDELKNYVEELLEGFEGFEIKYKSLKNDFSSLKNSYKDRSSLHSSIGHI